MRALFIIVSICITVNAQSREELHKRYGSPISETFAARPGVFVTTSFAESGEVCEMIIHAQPLTESLDFPITKIMESRVVKEIIDDLVPMSQRGQPLGGEFLNIVCLPLNNCFGVSESYERDTIRRTGGTDKERYATIRWKTAACHR
jgi:hypothetical protein